MPWEDGEEDVDTSGETYVTGVWEGEDTAYSVPAIPIPDAFHETAQRKAEMFDALIAILKESARPMGLSPTSSRPSSRVPSPSSPGRDRS